MKQTQPSRQEPNAEIFSQEGKRSKTYSRNRKRKQATSEPKTPHNQPTNHPRFDPIIYTLKLLTVGAPLAAASYLLIRKDKTNEIWRMLLNGTLIALFLTLLLIGSYLAPVSYPHYFYVEA